MAQDLEQLEIQNSESEIQKREVRLGFVYAIIAVIFFGSSAVLVLYADPIPPLEKTFWRLVIATSFIFCLLKITRTTLGWQRASLGRFALYGFVTALHFIFYISSLSFTTAARALTLVNTAPIFLTIMAAVFLKESMPRRKWLGIGLAAIGVAILAGFEPTLSTEMLIGDLMALAAGITYALYSLAGRRERENYSLFSYAFGVYGFAALWVMPFAAWSFFSGKGLTNYSFWPVMALLALGIFPLGLGHTLYNAALRRVHATYANIIGTQEITIGILLSWLFFNQQPAANTLIGAAITLVGILVVLI